MATVRIKNLKPNPFRRMDRYPIDRSKVEALKASIKDTSFWDNILARPAPDADGYQIAYGHHRLVALKELLKDGLIGDEVDIPVRNLDDATMIKVMGNENLEHWENSTKIRNETVLSVKEFLDRTLAEFPDYDHFEKRADRSIRALFSSAGNFEQCKVNGVGREIITKFLGDPWKPAWIQQALAVLNDSEIDRDAVESFENPNQAEAFRAAVKEKGVPKEQQQTLAKEISRKIGDQGQRLTGSKIEEEVHTSATFGKPLSRTGTKGNVTPEVKEKGGHSTNRLRSSDFKKIISVTGFIKGDKIYVMGDKIALYDRDKCYGTFLEIDLQCSIKDAAGFFALVKKISERFRLFRPESGIVILETPNISASFACEEPGPDYHQAAALARGEEVPWKQTPPNF
jgi:hypothetical protein